MFHKIDSFMLNLYLLYNSKQLFLILRGQINHWLCGRGEKHVSNWRF